MRSDLRNHSRPRRRALGAVVGLLAVVGVTTTGCGGDEAGRPAISGDSPGDVTVPTVPPTTAGPTGDDQEQTEAEAPEDTAVGDPAP